MVDDEKPTTFQQALDVARFKIKISALAERQSLVPGMTWHNACPKCDGSITMYKVLDGHEFSCLRCGRLVFFPHVLRRVGIA